MTALTKRFECVYCDLSLLVYFNSRLQLLADPNCPCCLQKLINDNE